MLGHPATPYGTKGRAAADEGLPAAMAAHPGAEIIDLGIGEPDEMAFPEVVEKLCAEARKPENRGYADNGDAVLKQAAARYLDRVCGVKGINPETEVIHSIGSKAALSILPATLINPGDYVLMTVPGYPIFGTHAKYLDGRVHNLPLTEGNRFLPDLNSVPAAVLKQVKGNRPAEPCGTGCGWQKLHHGTKSLILLDLSPS